MNSLGFDDARLLEGGLLSRQDQDSEPRPRFRGRLMFPILDVMGGNVGFGGRILGSGEPKYLNSAESPIFSKGKLLYGLNRSRNHIRRADRALIVEGYFDAMRLMSSGIEEVVAPLGTALTESQAALLKKYTSNIYLLYDSDSAGLKATFRAGDELLSQGFSVRVVTLPAGEDPDTFVRTNGAAGLEDALTKAIDVFDRKIQILDRAGWFGELQKKRRALDRLLPTIRATSDEIMRDLYIGRASEVTGVDRAILLRELDSRRAAPQPAPRIVERDIPSMAPAIRGRTSDRRETRRDAGTSAERELVRAMLAQRSQVESIAERVGPDSFRNRDLRAIFSALLEIGEDASLEELATKLDSEAIALAEELLEDSDAIVDAGRTIDDSITKLTVRGIEDRLTEIDGLLALASSSEKDELEEEKKKLVVQMRASGKGSFKAFRRSRPR